MLVNCTHTGSPSMLMVGNVPSQYLLLRPDTRNGDPVDSLSTLGEECFSCLLPAMKAEKIRQWPNSLIFTVFSTSEAVGIPFFQSLVVQEQPAGVTQTKQHYKEGFRASYEFFHKKGQILSVDV